MDTVSPIPSLWGKLAEVLYLRDMPTAVIDLPERTSFSYGRIQSDGLLDRSRPLLGEQGHIVVLQLKPLTFIEQFLGRKKLSSSPYPVGGVSVLHLAEEPAVVLPSPFDSLVLNVTQAALDEITYAHHAPQVQRLVWPQGEFDPAVHHLGQTLLFSLENPLHASKLFLEHVLLALNHHFVVAYGDVKLSAARFRGGLTPMQSRRATSFLESHLDGEITLQHVAEICDLSVSHFARAFKQTFRMPPYRWLLQRRVDKAKDLMTHSRLTIAEIAMQCGFPDQSALNRTFKRIHGVTPGVWRQGQGTTVSSSGRLTDDRCGKPS